MSNALPREGHCSRPSSVLPATPPHCYYGHVTVQTQTTSTAALLGAPRRLPSLFFLPPSPTLNPLSLPTVVLLRFLTSTLYKDVTRTRTLTTREVYSLSSSWMLLGHQDKGEDAKRRQKHSEQNHPAPPLRVLYQASRRSAVFPSNISDRRRCHWSNTNKDTKKERRTREKELGEPSVALLVPPWVIASPRRRDFEG